MRGHALMKNDRRGFLKHSGMIGLGVGLGAVSPRCFAKTASPSTTGRDVVPSGGKLLHEIARRSGRPAGAPRVSDVSIRFFSIRQGVSAERMFEAGRAFHITRADWSYITDPEFIRKVRDMGWSFQGTTNAITHNLEHARRHADGKPVLDHFNREGRWMADPNIASYRDWYVGQVMAWIEAGVTSFQRDEPSGLGGLDRAWEPDEADAFFSDVHARIANKAGGRQVTWSCNLVWNQGRFADPGQTAAKYTRHFAYGMSEINAGNLRPDFLWELARDTHAKGRAMVLTGDYAIGVARMRRGIATAYANAMGFIVPWDQFGGVNSPRIFMAPRDLADLYAFVRGISPYLEGYEDAAAAGPGITDSRWPDRGPVSIMDRAGELSAFVRARPGEAGAPIVIHLIDQSDRPRPFGVRLDRRAFPGQGRLDVALLTPASYDAAKHAEVWDAANRLRGPGALTGPEQASAYTPLVIRTPVNAVDEGDAVTLDIPALSPWGALLVGRPKR